jgi:hypothetical protein
LVSIGVNWCQLVAIRLMFAQSMKAHISSMDPSGLLAREERCTMRLLCGMGAIDSFKESISLNRIFDSFKESISANRIIMDALAPVFDDLPAEYVYCSERTKTYSTLEVGKILFREESVIRKQCSEAWNTHDGPGPLKPYSSRWVVETPSAEGGRRCGWRLEKRD